MHSLPTPTFAIIGTAGFVAPRHLEAIKQIGRKLTAVTDPNNNPELPDDFFPGCEFFKEGHDIETHQ